MFVSGKYTCKNHANPGISAGIVQVYFSRCQNYRTSRRRSLGLLFRLGGEEAVRLQAREKGKKVVAGLRILSAAADNDY